MNRIRWFALTALCALAAAGTADARPALHSLGTFAEGPLVDSGRYVVWTARYSPTAVIKILDAEKGRSSEIPGSTRCQLDDAHRGLALAGCQTPTVYQQPTIIDLARHSVIATPAVRDPYSQHFYRIGTNWLLGANVTQVGDAYEWVYRNWHTGETRTVPNPLFPDDYSGQLPADRNLDDPALGPAPSPRPGRYRLRGADSYGFTRPGRPISLWQGGRRLALLSRCSKGCRFAKLAYGLAGWTEGRTLRAYVASSGQRWSWRFPPEKGGCCDPHIDVLRHYIVVERHPKLYIARWRR